MGCQTLIQLCEGDTGLDDRDMVCRIYLEYRVHPLERHDQTVLSGGATARQSSGTTACSDGHAELVASPKDLRYLMCRGRTDNADRNDGFDCQALVMSVVLANRTSGKDVRLADYLFDQIDYVAHLSLTSEGQTSAACVALSQSVCAIAPSACGQVGAFARSGPVRRHHPTFGGCHLSRGACSSGLSVEHQSAFRSVPVRCTDPDRPAGGVEVQRHKAPEPLPGPRSQADALCPGVGNHVDGWSQQAMTTHENVFVAPRCHSAPPQR